MKNLLLSLRAKRSNLGVSDINRLVIASSLKNSPRNDHLRFFGKLLSSSLGFFAGLLGAAWPAFRAGTGTAILMAAAACLPAAPVRSRHDDSPKNNKRLSRFPYFPVDHS
jgi:hypothetical protein